MNTLLGNPEGRADGYVWIAQQMHRKLDVALTYLHSYVGQTVEDKTKLFLGDISVDLVRHRSWNYPFAVVAQSGWQSLTNASTGTGVRKTIVIIYHIILLCVVHLPFVFSYNSLWRRISACSLTLYNLILY